MRLRLSPPAFCWPVSSWWSRLPPDRKGSGRKAGHRRAASTCSQKKIEAAREREGVLTSQIAVVTSKIRALQDDVDSASARLDQLENVLALHQRKLDRLNQLYRHPDAQARLPAAPAQGRDGAPEQAARRHLHLRPDLRADGRARGRELLRPARPARVPERHRRAGRADRERGQGRQAADAGDPERDPQDAQAGRGDDADRGGPHRRAAGRARPARLEPARARHRPARQARDARDRPGGQAGRARAHALAAGAERGARSADPLRPELVDRARPDRRGLGCGLRLAGARRPHERLRLALGTDARGHRPRRRRAGRRSSPPRPGR